MAHKQKKYGTLSFEFSEQQEQVTAAREMAFGWANVSQVIGGGDNLI